MTNIVLEIRAVEKDLTYIHRQRMTASKSDQYDALRNERAKASPDAEKLAALKAAMMQTDRDKRDTAITEREVLDPLRKRLAREQAAACGDRSR